MRYFLFIGFLLIVIWAPAQKPARLRAQFEREISHPESFGQLCSLYPNKDGKRLYAQLPLLATMSVAWSERQRRFFRLYRDSVIGWMGATIDRDGNVDLNYKTVIEDLHAIPLVPVLMKAYRRNPEDREILTLLMLLMRSARYSPFLASSVCHDLYGDGVGRSFFSSVILTPAIEKKILDLSDRFFQLERDGFALVPGGSYWVGKQGHLVNPRRQVRVDSFYISKYETTNGQFAAFVEGSGYVTVAEKRHDALVFAPGLEEFRWMEDSTAYWRYPNGVSRGGIGDKMDHPVTCICYLDILAYCRWAGVRLPTLEEWEIAARAGSSTDWFFGADDSAIAEFANVWHGRDHLTADSSDGYMYTSPVGHFRPNPWGLYDVYGNVFEFCSGKARADEPTSLAHARGGSWWCSTHACHYFNSYDIGRTNVRASFSNQGFRVAKNR